MKLKKLLVIGVTAALTAGAIAGCGSKRGGSGACGGYTCTDEL